MDYQPRSVYEFEDAPRAPVAPITEDDFRQAVRLAKEATNGWACYAKRKIEHDAIARLHHAIARFERG